MVLSLRVLLCLFIVASGRRAKQVHALVPAVVQSRGGRIHAQMPAVHASHIAPHARPAPTHTQDRRQSGALKRHAQKTMTSLGSLPPTAVSRGLSDAPWRAWGLRSPAGQLPLRRPTLTERPDASSASAHPKRDLSKLSALLFAALTFAFCWSLSTKRNASRNNLVGTTLAPKRQSSSWYWISARQAQAVGQPTSEKIYLNVHMRNALIIVSIGGVAVGSWYLTGKWWKVPLIFAVPSMIHRIWTTRGDTTKLAEVSASVDMKYVATSEKEKKELHNYMCMGCGYTIFPARNREGDLFPDKFKCPMCGAPKENFLDMSDDADDVAVGSPATPPAPSESATASATAGVDAGDVTEGADSAVLPPTISEGTTTAGVDADDVVEGVGIVAAPPATSEDANSSATAGVGAGDVTGGVGGAESAAIPPAPS